MNKRPFWRCAAPAVLLAALCLLPFLNKAYSIDDPYFLYEARQTLATPLTPTAASICWDNFPHRRPLREIGPSAAFAGYVLAPVILLGSPEWAGHLLIFLILAAAVVATVALAFRCGASSRQAMLAGLIFASTPVVLGMAGTVMPDIPVTALAVVGMERLLAWRQDRKIGQALASGIALGLAPLTRSHAILLLPLGALILAEGLNPPRWRAACQDAIRWLPVLLGGICFLLMAWLTSGAAPGAVLSVSPPQHTLALHNILRNLPAFGIDWLLTTALGVVWLVGQRRRALLTLAAILLAGQIVHYAMGYAPATALSFGLAGLVALAAVLVDSWRGANRNLFWLAVWLLIPLPILPYFHFPAKYLAPCAPAAAILVAYALSSLTGTRLAVASGLVVCMGAVLGVAILRADAEFAESARQVIAREIAPHIRAGGGAWYVGQWAVNWYAEKAGAGCLVNDPPYPRPGDLLIADNLSGGPVFAEVFTAPKRLIRTITDGDPGGRVLNPWAGAGFFSNRYGFWPWVWSSAPLNVYYIWEFE